MNIRTFVSGSVPGALARVRGTLGSEATIIALRRGRGFGGRRQVEITAVCDPITPVALRESRHSLDEQAWDAAAPYLPISELERETVGPDIGPAAWMAACDFLPGVAQELAALPTGSSHFTRAVAETLTSRLSGSCGVLPLGDQSRRIALIGPPGCGKTTALLKVAVQAVGLPRSDVAIVRLDGGRSGTGTDLAPFCQMLQVPILAEQDRHVQRGLPEAEGIILIDTEARIWGPDPGAAQARQTLADLQPDVICLVLSAAWRAADLLAAWRRYRICNPTHLLFSGLDLTSRYGGILSIAWLSRLPVAGAMISGRLDASTREFRPQALLQQMEMLGAPDPESALD